jgi:hypothetical protein
MQVSPLRQTIKPFVSGGDENSLGSAIRTAGRIWA